MEPSNAHKQNIAAPASAAAATTAAMGGSLRLPSAGPAVATPMAVPTAAACADLPPPGPTLLLPGHGAGLLPMGFPGMPGLPAFRPRPAGAGGQGLEAAVVKLRRAREATFRAKPVGAGAALPATPAQEQTTAAALPDTPMEVQWTAAGGWNSPASVSPRLGLPGAVRVSLQLSVSAMKLGRLASSSTVCFCGAAGQAAQAPSQVCLGRRLCVG
jgi:hypothetical protein